MYAIRSYYVQRQEHPYHPAQYPEQVEVKEPQPALDLAPGTEDGQHPKQPGEPHHQQGYVITSYSIHYTKLYDEEPP